VLGVRGRNGFPQSRRILRASHQTIRGIHTRSQPHAAFWRGGIGVLLAPKKQLHRTVPHITLLT
jgi:hypothetical protein